jgi:hypothetical protein
VFDLVVLLVPVLQAAVWAVRSPGRRSAVALLAGFLAVDGLALVMNLSGASYVAFIWMTPAILLGYLVSRSHLGRPRVLAC